MKLKQLIFVLVSLGVSLSCFLNFANAGLITHNGYTLNEETNIVSKGRLEWLQWDVTLNTSVDDALETHNGWRLATILEVDALFESIFFPHIFDIYPHTLTIPYGGNDLAFSNFLELFGYGEMLPDVSNEGENPYQRTFTNKVYRISALFHPPTEVSSHLLGVARVMDSGAYDYEGCFFGTCSSGTQEIDAEALYGQSANRFDYIHYYTGVALVRDIPEPSTITLFTLAIMGLASIRFKNQS